MKKTLAFNDYRLISVYLDGRCSAREKSAVESRLESDNEFKMALAEFKREKKMLQAIPRVKVPHNFTLSPALALQKPQRFFLAPALNSAALVLSVLFVFLFAGSRLLPAISAKQSVESAAPVSLAVPMNAVAEATSAPMITWGQGNVAAGGRGGGSDTVTSNGLGGGAPSGINPAPVTKFAGPEVTQTAPPVAATQPPTNATADDSNLILGMPSASDQGKEIAPSGSTVPAPTQIPWLLVAEIALAALAVILAVTSWIIRRRH